MGINDGPCRAPNCPKPAHSRGLCHMHYWRFAHGGSLELSRRPSEVERFWSKVDKNGPVPERRPELGPCWVWKAGLDHYGYGQFKKSGERQNVKAHRYVYELCVGPIPESLTIDHECNFAACVNPAHLRPMRSGPNAARVRLERTACGNGHPYTDGSYRIESGHRRCLLCRREARKRATGSPTPRPRTAGCSP